jgi:putative endonuclease
VNTVAKGREGEGIAARYLECKGYSIVKRNFRAYGAEIDLVAVKDETTVFAEVKYWSIFKFREMERVLNREKRNRIIRASMGFLNRYPVFSENSIRFDLLYLSDSSGNVEHVEDIFTEIDLS